MHTLGKTRIAPTPSGFLHRGNAYSFCLTYLVAKSLDLKLLLRIDDADQLRYRDAYAANIFETLLALGIEWDEGPQNMAELKNTWSQKHRHEQYQTLLKALRDANKLFACTCSRKEWQLLATENRAHFCLNKSLKPNSELEAWRLKQAPQSVKLYNFEGELALERWPQSMNEVVLKQKNGAVAYQLSSVADDAHFGVTHVIRGADLWDSTLCQVGLAQMLDLNFKSSRFFHHAILKSYTGQKLAKSQKAPAVLPLLQHPRKRTIFFKELSEWLGFKNSYGSLSEMTSALSQKSEVLKLS